MRSERWDETCAKYRNQKEDEQNPVAHTHDELDLKAAVEENVHARFKSPEVILYVTMEVSTHREWFQRASKFLVESEKRNRCEERLVGILSALKGGGLRSPNRIRHNGRRVSEILRSHAGFVRGDQAGVRADLAGADLSRANLERASLAYADLRGANLERANLREAKLNSADLTKVSLRGADLRKADLTEAHLAGADLTEAQVGGAELFRADLQQAILRHADFGATNFRDALVNGADFEGASLKTAILRETKLEGADLSRADISMALLPRGYSPPASKS